MITFVCGGTGGHVYPAIALAQELDPHSFFFIGSTDRQDKVIIEKHGFSFIGISPQKTSLLQKITVFFKAIKLLKAQKTKVLVATGGGQTALVACAAFCLTIPIILLEQNTIPGRTNRVLQFLASQICLTFPESLPYFKYSGKKINITGNPVRKFFLKDNFFETAASLELPQKPWILFFGGSQGAQKLNEFAHQHYDFFENQGYFFVHITGNAYYKTHFSETPFKVCYNEAGQIKGLVFPYFEKMDWLYEHASLVVCRSGATTIAELIAFNKPAILIPYPFAKDNHQVANAKSIESQGRGLMLEESKLSLDTLQECINSLTSYSPPEQPSSARELILTYIKAYL
jgi:UDP-N-acetylglucosamine--N-acetylmuramyl-(pentapeptide) pyrophosphoryl-undecaprenol N-acetylglucosamine transferase